MIERTRPYRSRSAPPLAPEMPAVAPSTESSATSPAAPAMEIPVAANAPNIDRRAWFGTLVPAFGDGLVKLLRASSNLRRDLEEIKGGGAPEEQKL